MKYKKLNIILFVLFVICFCCVGWWHFYRFSCEIYINSDKKIKLPPLKREKIIYRYEFREGEDFSILDYSNKNIEVIIKNNNFHKTSKNNVEEIKQILIRYQEDLCEEERKLFDKTVTINKLSTVGNYYLYLEVNKEDYYIFVINDSKNKLYYFHINH